MKVIQESVAFLTAMRLRFKRLRMVVVYSVKSGVLTLVLKSFSGLTNFATSVQLLCVRGIHWSLLKKKSLLRQSWEPSNRP